MKNALPEILLARVSGMIAERTGLSFPKERYRQLEQRIHAACQEFGHKGVETCVNWLLTTDLSKKDIEVLASHLTVGETYFFRDPRIFKALEEEILPPLIEARRNGNHRLRIWSAGCCTGEEPYSIAILLRRMIPDIEKWNVTILATDINPLFLKKASEGAYGSWSFRDAPPWLKTTYFLKSGARETQIASQVRKMVSISYLNLAEDVYPALSNNTNAMDLIFCRNVMMYFVQPVVDRMLDRFYRSLAPEGWLITGPIENLQIRNSSFHDVQFNGTTLYHKKAEGPHRARDRFEERAIPPTAALPPVDLDKVSEKLSEILRLKEEETRGPASTPVTEPNALSALFEQGKYAEVIAGIELEAAAPGPAQCVLMARSHANLGNLRDALAWCEKAIAQNGADEKLHYLHAAVLQEQGHIDEAVEALRKSIFLKDDFALAFFALGNLLRRQGKNEESRRQFESARLILSSRSTDEMLLESDGITVGKLSQIIDSLPAGEVNA